MKKREFLKQKSVYIVLIFAILLTLFCVIRILLPKQSYHYSLERTFSDGIEKEEEVLYDQIKLPAGVYEFAVAYQTDTDIQNIISVSDGTVFEGGLLTNGELTYVNRESTGFRVWLFENTEALQVTLKYGGAGYVAIGNLTIRETNALWTMLLTMIWGITLFILTVLRIIQYDRTVGIAKEKKTVWIGLLMIILIASLPYLQGGTMDSSDTGYHLHRIEGVKDGILSGQFPLRLEPKWLYGHGYANGIFYCNILLYLPAVFRLLGFTINTCYNLYGIAVNIATACIAYWCFAKIFKDRYIGLLCSALYTLSVIRIYKLAFTAAIGEGSAMIFMPLVLYGLYRVFSEDAHAKSYKSAWIPVAIGYAGLLQTHVLSCEITVFLTIIVCLVYSKKIFVKETFLELAKAALSAFAMSCWYLIPFLDYYINEDLHIKHVSGRTIQERGLYIPQLFFNWWEMGDNALNGDWGMTESQSMGVGLILGLAFILFAVLWFSGVFREKKDSVISLGKISCILSGMLMLMSLNLFPWDAIQQTGKTAAALVSSIQFPNRFLSWGSVFLTVLGGCLLWYFKNSGKKWYYYMTMVCILTGLATSSIYLTDHICGKKFYLNLYNEEGMGYGYISGKEYIIEGTESDHLRYDKPTASEETKILTYEKEYLQVWMHCCNTDLTEGYVELPLLHYKGYRAYRTETGEELPTQKGTNNLVRVLLPAGFDGEIEVKFVSPVYWRVSEAVTFLWYAAAALGCVKNMRKQRKERIG